MSKIIGAVEIGTSKAKALIGEVSENSVINVVGMASRLNEGMRKEKLLILEKLLRQCTLLLRMLRKCPAPQLMKFILLRLDLI